MAQRRKQLLAAGKGVEAEDERFEPDWQAVEKADLPDSDVEDGAVMQCVHVPSDARQGAPAGVGADGGGATN